MTRIESSKQTPNSSQSFQGIALKMLDDLQQTPKSSKGSKPGESITRKRVNPFSELVTSDEKFEEIEKEEKEKEAKKKEREARKKEKEAKKKDNEAQKKQKETKMKDPRADKNNANQRYKPKKRCIQKKQKCDDNEEFDEETDEAEFWEELDEYEISSDESRPEHEEICSFPPTNDHELTSTCILFGRN